jgi:hypothetical protein
MAEMWESVDYQRAGADHPRTLAFHAACEALQRRGVDLAQTRADVAERVVMAIIDIPAWRLLGMTRAECSDIAADIRSASTGMLPNRAVITSAVAAAVLAVEYEVE